VSEMYRMLGKEREAELLREALRLQAGQTVRGRARGRRARPHDAVRGAGARLLTRLRSRMPRPASTIE